MPSRLPVSSDAGGVAGRDGRGGDRGDRTPRSRAACLLYACRRAGARGGARARSAHPARRSGPGRLPACPVGIKDLVLTSGIRTTFGSRLYADFVPDEDDIAVERLRAAGAIILGKTNAAEFGYGGFGHNPLFPTTRNPWNLELTPGGSSAGSAAAVAAGIVPDRARQRWRRLGPPAGRILRPGRHQADHGPHPALAGLPRRDAARRLRLGIDRALRAADPHRRRRGADAVRDHRPRSARPAFAARRGRSLDRRRPDRLRARDCGSPGARPGPTSPSIRRCWR